MSPTRFALVAFDLDGVLVDTSRSHARAYAELWERLGTAGPPYADIAGRRTAEVVLEVAAPLGLDAARLEEAVGFKQRRARELLTREAVVFEDAAPCVRSLGARGVCLALGTAASRETVQLALAWLGLAGAFDVVVSAEDVRIGKPGPEVYRLCCARADVEPSRTLVVEDSAAGIAAARAAGTWLACVRSGLAEPGSRCLGSFTDLRALELALARGERCPGP